MARPTYPNAELLRAIARGRGVRLRSDNAVDPNVPGLSRHRLGLSLEGRRVALRASEEYVTLEVHGELDVGVCSLGRADRVFMTSAAEPPIELLGLGAFVRTPPSEATRRFLASPQLLAALERLALGPEESLHAYNNAIVAYLRPSPSVERVLDAADALRALVDAFEVPPREDPLDDLPSSFRPLIPLVRRWGIGDDELRGDRIEDASEEDLRELVGRVAPQLAKIEAYLDSFGDAPLSEAACALQALALCAVEARATLER